MLAVGALRNIRGEQVAVPGNEATIALGKPTINDTVYAARKKDQVVPTNQPPLIPDIFPIQPVVPQLPETPVVPVKPPEIGKGIGIKRPKGKYTDEQIENLWYNQRD